uniref:Uncharacterized protein n=1 Tax=uncultured marine thaumarchaeote KM3_126_D02 TaxID=1455994 RepID=A0A075G7C9_9ARCH|nr:hypothetical protein [uncultured marine thaumarchaeote KM3_126_D02]
MYRSLSILTVLIIISTVPLVSSEVMRGEFTVPDWVKNTAGWWASEQIPDSAFQQGIQYLIKEGIMIVEIPTEIDSEAAEEVPGWVKNTVGWWAEDKIHDTTFVSGIEYLIGKGIIVVEQEVEVEEPVEEVVEIKNFYMEVNGGSCCFNWSYVGEEYRFQIETYDEQHGKYIDGVEINAKIISKDGELRHDFGEVTTDDGIYRNSIIIPSMDWYAGNILSVTAEYYGVEKTIEKEFEVFKNKGGTSGGSGAAAGNCAHVSPFSVATQDSEPKGIAFSKSATKMFVVGNDDDADGKVHEYTLTGAYCIGSASFVDSFSTANSGASENNPTGIAFSKSGDKMFIVGATNNNQGKVSEYTLTTAWDVSTASFVDSLNVKSCGADCGAAFGLAFSKSGNKMFVMVSKIVDAVEEYTLTAPWDVSTASFVDSFSVATQETVPTGIAFSKSGDKMFIVGTQGDDINEYTLTTAWDASTASFVDSFSVNSQESNPQDIWFDSSGKTMFIVGQNGDEVNVYKLTTAWDVSTASFTG